MKKNESKPRIYQKTAERVNAVLKDNGISQADLQRMLLGLPPNEYVNTAYICGICGGYKRLTEKMAKRISELFHGEYSEAYLLGYTDDKNDVETSKKERFYTKWNGFVVEQQEKHRNESISILLGLCGAHWTGNDYGFTIPKEKGKCVSDQDPVVATYKGVPLTSWDLNCIAAKVIDIVSIELKHICRKKQTEQALSSGDVEKLTLLSGYETPIDLRDRRPK